MKGSAFAATLPVYPSEVREQLILTAVESGNFLPIEWRPVVSTVGDSTATFYVASDALCIGEPDDYFRVNVTHTTAQRIADRLGVALPTTRLSDITHQQATCRITPCTRAPNEFMSTTFTMRQHSKMVQDRIDDRVRDGTDPSLVSTVGKDWVLTNRLEGKPDKAANYGWHVSAGQFKGPGGLSVLQPLGLAHNRFHVDYSQVLRLVNRWVRLDGTTLFLEDLLQYPSLAPLASDEGVMRVVRHPGVPKEFEVEPPLPDWGS